MLRPGHEPLYMATSVADAVEALAARGAEGAALAGATWIMRAPLRREAFRPAYVALSGIEALRAIAVSAHEVAIGACVTHARLAAALAGLPDLHALALAAGKSANPAIREVATVGGNLCATDFMAPDLVPALLCLDAAVDIESLDGPERMPMAAFLAARASLRPGHLVRRVVVPRGSGRSTHIRLPLRKAGDYPVATVSLAVERGEAGACTAVRIAVGAVEAVARRWPALEAALLGQVPDAERAAHAAERTCDGFVGRDGIEAPGWYRVKVLPALVRRAVQAILSEGAGFS